LHVNERLEERPRRREELLGGQGDKSYKRRESECMRSAGRELEELHSGRAAATWKLAM
jgi:hypothetical protein